MGYEIQHMSIGVSVRVSRHNDERDTRDNELAEELGTRLREAVVEIVSDPKYQDIEPIDS